jgi:molybdate transport system substrate-binding protein
MANDNIPMGRRFLSLAAGAAVAVAALASPPMATRARAAELKVFASTATRTAIAQLGAQFETATENKLAYTVDAAAVLKTQIDQGAAFDVAIITAPLIDALAAAGKIDPATRVIVARAGLGVSIRAGAAKPDVSTPDALKRTLLNAASIGYAAQGTSRSGTEAMLAKLGIADALKPKIKLLDGPAPLGVAAGEVELGLGPVSEILPVAGIDLVGPYPSELQSYLVFAAAVSSTSDHAEAAKALIKLLTGPVAAPVLTAKGLEPG